ncbi:MAG: hypothetical protein R6V33_03540 [Pelovirga sp.]
MTGNSFKAYMMTLCLVLLFSVAPATAELTSPDQIPRINVIDLRSWQSSEPVVFVDTRTAGQWQQAVDKISGAQRITSQTELDEFKRTVPRDTVIVTYCT